MRLRHVVLDLTPVAGAPPPAALPLSFFVVSPGPMAWAYGVAVCLAAAVFWALAGFAMIVYHVVLSATLLPLLAWRQPRAAAAFGQLALPPALRFVALGYAAVILEETLVGTLAALLAEGDVTVWAARVGQFILLNLFVFTGLIGALAAHALLFRPHRFELIVLAGGWGLFAEAILQRLLSAPLMAGLLVWPTLVVYALILMPATLSVQADRGRRDWPLALRAPLVWVGALALSLPMLAAVSHLSEGRPWLFPPCDYTGCTLTQPPAP